MLRHSLSIAARGRAAARTLAPRTLCLCSVRRSPLVRLDPFGALAAAVTVASAVACHATASRSECEPRPIKILCLHGITSDMFGKRDVSTYGSTTLQEIDAALVALASQMGVEIECFQGERSLAQPRPASPLPPGSMLTAARVPARPAQPTARGQSSSASTRPTRTAPARSSSTRVRGLTTRTGSATRWRSCRCR